jgi:hypothetical protein
MQTAPPCVKRNFREILISLCDIRDNYEGEVLLETLINDQNFMQIAMADHKLSVKVLGALFP